MNLMKVRRILHVLPPAIPFVKAASRVVASMIAHVVPKIARRASVRTPHDIIVLIRKPASG